MQTRGPTRQALLLVSLCVALGELAFGAEHPQLVSAEEAECSFCHEDLLDGGASQHAPASDDCTVCHEFSIAEETTVSLADTEPDLCLFCHDDLAAAAALEIEAPHFPVGDSCLTCHDPHSSDVHRLLTAAPAELCSICHDVADLNQKHGEQLLPATNCTVCHQPHGAEHPSMLVASNLHAPVEGGCDGCHLKPFGGRIRLRARGERLCEACHGDLAESTEGGGSVHPALHGEHGRAGCLSCHNPHLSDRSSLLLHEGPELCSGCHEGIVHAAQAETGHFPAAEDCLTCHGPHTSSESRLLLEPPAQLCATCHEVDPADESLVAAHLGADLTRLACTGCHSPHGTENAKLLAENLHPPLLDGCDTCHEGAFNELYEDGSSELCLICHDDIGDFAQSAPTQHAALELGSCTDCHNPHATAQEKLVKSAGAGPCGDCHDEQLPGAGEVSHGAIELVGCRACHEPHGGENEKLLRKEGPELCLTCHAAGAVQVAEGETTFLLADRFEVAGSAAKEIAQVLLSADGERDHPVAGHRTLGTATEAELRSARVETDFEGELTCLVCHDPHKGRSEQLFRWNAASGTEACQQCHQK
jgi:predicted CXXCH cytochrome family protein